MFVDHIQLKITAGKGGNGIVAWRREKYLPKGGPYGGNGGPGGNVAFKATTNLYSLENFRTKRILKAENGGAGGTSLQQGRRGKDLIMSVPCGTLIKDPKTGALIDDLTVPGQTCVISTGGRGGRGNASFASPRNRAPNVCTAGRPGEACEVLLELKLIADIGLVGFPNAGKSSLLEVLTGASPKVASYPFTTLSPNLGEIIFDDYQTARIADVPGIIEDASQDKGLGLEFLRHIERTKTLFFVLDGADNPEQTLATLRHELHEYNPALLRKPNLILLNKSDLETCEKELLGEETLAVSAETGEGLEKLKETLYTLLNLGERAGEPLDLSIFC